MASSVLQATVKWGAKSFSVQVDPNEPLEVFQAQLFSLTGVPVERQKLLTKGKTLKTDADLQDLASAGILKITLMGTAETSVAPAKPVEKTVFVEDLTPAQQAAMLKEKQIEPLPNGVVNLGNTCYLASVLQMLRPATDFALLLKAHLPSGASTAQFAATGPQGALRRLAVALKDFYNQWDQTTEAVSPFLLVPALREAYPQFSRRSTASAGTTGVPMQQDAEECLSCLMTAVSESLEPGSATALAKTLPYASPNPGPSALDLLFGVQVEVTTKKAGDGNENEKGAVQIERHRKLTCFLGTPQKPVSTLDDGLKFSLGDEIVQVGNNTSGDGAVDESVVRSTRVSGLSLYLIVHFMRFEWKQAGSEAEKAKICRSVKFSQTLDMYAYCTKELQESFKVGRAVVALRREREAATGNTKAVSSAASASATNGSNTSATASSLSGNPVGEDAKPEAGSGGSSSCTPSTRHLAGKPCPTGYYQLLSVVTHQGRYADSGHYVGWARAAPAEGPQGPLSPKEDREEEEKESKPAGPAAKRQKNVVMWRKFDDDKVTEVPWDSIDLAGGRSDYHVAYLLLLKHMLIVPSEEELVAIEKHM